MEEITEKTTPKKAIAKRATVKKATRKRASSKRVSTQSIDLFASYLEKIKQARIDSQELIAPFAKEDKSSLVINLIWEAIFDYFCRIDKEEISPSNLNTMAGVVQKLLASSKATTPKESDASSTCISAQALAEIEDKLNLL